MKKKAEEIKKIYEGLATEEQKSMSRLAELIEKRAMKPEAVTEMMENIFSQATAAEEQHPELEIIEGMTHEEYAKAYKKMAEQVAAHKTIIKLNFDDSVSL